MNDYSNPKFKVGEKVVVPHGFFGGRPKILTIEKLDFRNGFNFYFQGNFGAREDFVEPESTFVWPNEFEMRRMDKKAKMERDKLFNDLENCNCCKEVY